MLSREDIELIRENRKQITEGRTTRILAWGRLLSSTNPVTGEEVYADSPKVAYDVIWKIPMKELDEEDTMLLGGYTVEADDRLVTFNDPDIDIESLDYVEHEGIVYKLVAKSPVGLGGTNRFECIARLKA
jgi:hypothetical protein